ncbi:MAG: hypothetical protein NTY53_26745 [Kiritimatiellaeota bacterium]|nr:hypothetical protein [Kiritimatiellota bacterium]
MNCWYHRWLLSHAADRREAAPRATQAHLAGCDACRTYADLCARLPRALASSVPATPETGWLEQRVLAQTTRAPESSKAWKNRAKIFQGLEKNPRNLPTLGKIAGLFSNPWKPALAAAALLLLAAVGWQQWHAAQTQQRLAALQTMRSFYDTAAATVGPAALQDHVNAEAQRLANDAAAAVEFLGGLLPVATPPSST